MSESTKELRQPKGCAPMTGSPVFAVDYDLIRKVMDSIQHLGDDSDSDCACRRVYCRMLAEATGMPLAGHRLLMEKEVRPKYRKDYVLAPKFQENDHRELPPPPMSENTTESYGG